MYSGSVYRGRVQSTTLTPTCTPPTPPFLLLEVAPSILQNAVRLASRLLQLLHFTSWLVGLSTSSHAPFFSPLRISYLSSTSLSVSVPLTFALESQTNAAASLWSEPELIQTSRCGSPGLWPRVSGRVVMLP